MKENNVVKIFRISFLLITSLTILNFMMFINVVWLKENMKLIFSGLFTVICFIIWLVLLREIIKKYFKK